MKKMLVIAASLLALTGMSACATIHTTPQTTPIASVTFCNLATHQSSRPADRRSGCPGSTLGRVRTVLHATSAP